MTSFIEPHSGQTARVVHMTPEMAVEWLKKNWINRPLHKQAIKKYKRCLLTGKWYLNGETLIRDGEGLLLDGQNRLTACVESGIPFDSWVIDGVPKEFFSSLDDGDSRNGGDALPKDISQRGAVKAISRLIYQYETGTITVTDKVSNKEVLDIYTRHRLIESVIGKVRLMPKGLASAAMYFGVYGLLLLDPEKAVQVVEKLQSGAIEKGDPVLTLRNYLAFTSQSKNARATRGNGAASVERFWLIIKAFNAVLENKEIKVLRLGEQDSPISLGTLKYGTMLPTLESVPQFFHGRERAKKDIEIEVAA